MEEQLVHVLEQTQSPQPIPRKQAEQHLQDLYHNPDYPLTLCSIASHTSASVSLRQAALLNLKTFILAGWSSALDEFQGQVLINDENKVRVRNTVLELATCDNTEWKIQAAASYVVSKIASADFPQDWSGLLPTILHIIPSSTGSRLHGALKVLADLVEDGFSEGQFFGVAQELVNTVQGVAQNVQIEPGLRALAVSVFRCCFDTLEMVLEDHKAAVKSFAEQGVNSWMPLFADVMSMKLPAKDEQPEQYNGIIALKLQVVKVLMRVRIMFPTILQPRSMALFSATWEELSTLANLYQSYYIDDNQEGRLEDPDGLPYTLDFLAVDDLDFLQACFRAPPVAKELAKQLQVAQPDGSPSNWIVDLLRLATTYAQITSEEEAMWELDINVFLSEETGVTAHYTPRTACGDLVVKLGEKHLKPTLDALLSMLNQSEMSPRLQESTLFLLNQMLLEWGDDEDRAPDTAVSAALLEKAKHAMQHNDLFLRSRGFLVASTLVKVADQTVKSQCGPLLEATLQAVVANQAEVVQAACIRALQNYLSSIPKSLSKPLQNSIITAIAHWYGTKDASDFAEGDDLIVTVLETLRDAIMLDPTICISGEGMALLFSVASRAASNFQVTALVTEVFEEICESIEELGVQQYTELCDKTVPSLAGAFEVSDLKEENPLAILAAELLSSLSSHAPSPLPPNFIPIVLPKLTPHLLHSDDSEMLKSATATLRNILQHDSTTLFYYNDPTMQKSGLETALIIIDRLLGPSVSDAAAAEVGGLAGEVVEKAGHAQLGPYLIQLLQAVAQRLARASHAQLIQSLIIVFARLAVHNAAEIVDFLASLDIPTSSLPSPPTTTSSQTVNGLHHILPLWLDSSATFAGHSAIATNIHALTALYSLHDPRIASIPCKGDLIPNPATAGRIVTRSRAKQTPDVYTTVSADVKIVKVLVEEIALPADSAAATRHATAGNSDDEDSGAEDDGANDEDWEDDQAFLDLGLGATKAELMGFANEGGAIYGGMEGARRTGDETQVFLGQWFRGMAENVDQARRSRFVEIVQGLNEGERARLAYLS